MTPKPFCPLCLVTLPAEGYIPVQNCIARSYVSLDHPHNSPDYSHAVARVFPIASLSVYEGYALMNKSDNTLWEPQVSDLTEAGKMLLSVAMDAYPDRGEAAVTTDFIPMDMSELAPEVQAEIAVKVAELQFSMGYDMPATGVIQ